MNGLKTYAVTGVNGLTEFVSSPVPVNLGFPCSGDPHCFPSPRGNKCTETGIITTKQCQCDIVEAIVSYLKEDLV
jgi:hypothetical protein